MPIDLSGCGPSAEDARQAVDEVVRVFIASASAHGTLDEVLEEAGYRREIEAWKSPVWLGVECRLAEV